jgi:hypothetical protein
MPLSMAMDCDTSAPRWLLRKPNFVIFSGVNGTRLWFDVDRPVLVPDGLRAFCGTVGTTKPVVGEFLVTAGVRSV